MPAVGVELSILKLIRSREDRNALNCGLVEHAQALANVLAKLLCFAVLLAFHYLQLMAAEEVRKKSFRKRKNMKTGKACRGRARDAKRAEVVPEVAASTDLTKVRVRCRSISSQIIIGVKSPQQFFHQSKLAQMIVYQSKIERKLWIIHSEPQASHTHAPEKLAPNGVHASAAALSGVDPLLKEPIIVVCVHVNISLGTSKNTVYLRTCS